MRFREVCMKVLWLVNIVMPEACECFNINSTNTGGWLVGAYNNIIDKLDSLVIVTTFNGESVKSCRVGKTEYYLVPQVNTAEHFKNLLESNDFDIIHIFGTELLHFKEMVSVCDLQKTIVTIQGLTSIIVNHFLDGIPDVYRKESKIRTFLSGLLHAEKPIYDLFLGFKNMADSENNSVYCVENFAGRTRFDRAFVRQNIPNSRYFKVNETLRDSFYSDITWDVEKCEKHSIFIPQAHYPIKGFHVFLESLHCIKNRFPDVKVYIAGPGQNLTPRKGLRRIKDKFFRGYFSYCKSIINKYDLYDCITFTGPLDEEQMKNQLLSSNVFVLPSLIENSPNSLGEAMILGVPCVASYVGGIPDMLQDGYEGILVHSTDTHMLADAIIQILENNELSTEFSKNAKNKANTLFDRKANAESLLGAYKTIKEEHARRKS